MHGVTTASAAKLSCSGFSTPCTSCTGGQRVCCVSQRGKGSTYSPLVVLEGSVVLSVDNKEGEVLQPGKTLFSAFCSWQVFARGTVAATVALAFLEPLQRRPNRKHLGKKVQELAETGAQVKVLRL